MRVSYVNTTLPPVFEPSRWKIGATTLKLHLQLDEFRERWRARHVTGVQCNNKHCVNFSDITLPGRKEFSRYTWSYFDVFVQLILETLVWNVMSWHVISHGGARLTGVETGVKRQLDLRYFHHRLWIFNHVRLQYRRFESDKKGTWQILFFD